MNATSGCVGDNVGEPGDIENMHVGAGILFLAILCAVVHCWDSVSSGLGGRYIYFRYNATSGDIVDSTIEQLDLENMGVAVEILSVWVSWNSR